MKKSRYTNSQILSILKQNEAGALAPVLCREHGMSNATFYKRRSKYGGMAPSLMKLIKSLLFNGGAGTAKSLVTPNIQGFI